MFESKGFTILALRRACYFIRGLIEVNGLTVECAEVYCNLTLTF